MTHTFYGTDSVTHAQQVMPGLKKAWGVIPAWHARYVCAPTASYNTDKAELAYMLGLGQRVAFVFDGRAGAGYALTDEAAGRADATVAMAVISALCPSKKPLLMDDIESNQVVNLAHFRGWSGALRDADWPGGYYIPISQDVYSQVYGQLVPLMPRKHRLIWTAQWYNPTFYPPPGPDWNPRVGIGIDDLGAVVMQQVNGQVPGLSVYSNLALQEAYDYMLSPAPVKVPVWHVTHTCALKPEIQASHSTPSIHTCLGGDVVLLT